MALIHSDDRLFTPLSSSSRKSSSRVHPAICFAAGIAFMALAGLAVHYAFNLILALPLFRGS